MMTLTGEEWTTLVLRIVLLAILYGVIALVVVIGLAEIRALAEMRTRDRSGDQMRLVVIEGPADLVNRSWPLKPVTTIGRTAGNAVVIDAPYLSGMHAEIVREHGGWWVRDAGSTNGTRVNGRPVSTRSAIEPGDVVQFGFIRLLLVEGTEPEA